MPILKTILHHYHYPSGAHPAYKALVEKITANAEGRGHWMNALANPGELTGCREGTERSEPVELETSFLFGNQWNEAEAEGKRGRRLFDWYEMALWNGGLRSVRKCGHWLEITPEMAEARRLTFACGYCGAHYGPFHSPPPAEGFCPACLDSEYLKPEELHLLRLRPEAEEIETVFSVPKGNRDPLTDEERAVLMPRYINRQTTGTDSRANKRRAKQRADVLSKFEKETSAALAERDGMLWLWDHGVSLDNVIYYDHTRLFSFGWRSAVAPEVKSALLDLLCEFPFPYEIKATDGKTSTVAKV